MSLWLLLLLLPALIQPLPLMTPINMPKCHHNEWIVRHFIVYVCTYYNITGLTIDKRELRPIGCDPSNGINTKLGNKPVFPGQEHRGDDGFVYECVRDNNGVVTYRAKACFMNQERFLPGHFIRDEHNAVFFCYRELDNLVRLRIRRPVHQNCNPFRENDPNCRLGIIQTVINSYYAMAEPYSYNPLSFEPITTKAPERNATEQLTSTNPPKLVVLEDRPKVANNYLLQAIQGHISAADILKKQLDAINLNA